MRGCIDVAIKLQQLRFGDNHPIGSGRSGGLDSSLHPVQVYAAGLTEDQLLELQGGPIPDEIADQINEIVAGCYSLDEGSGSG